MLGTYCYGCLKKMVHATELELDIFAKQADRELTRIKIFSGIGLILGILLGALLMEYSVGEGIFCSLWCVGVGGIMGYFSVRSIDSRKNYGDIIGHSFIKNLYLVVGFFVGMFVGLIFTPYLFLTRRSMRNKCWGVIYDERILIRELDKYLHSEQQYDEEKLRWAVTAIARNFGLTRSKITAYHIKRLTSFNQKEYDRLTKTAKPSIAYVNEVSVNTAVTKPTGHSNELSDHNYAISMLRKDRDEQTKDSVWMTENIKIIFKEDCFIDDRDGQKYRTAKIGDQVWMAENLNYKIDNSWSYDNDESNCKKYGRLYTWKAAMAACPVGWRLPSNDDWNKLITMAGGSAIAGKILKAKNGWNNNGNGIDDERFSALSGGYRVANGKFGGIGDYGNWWTATVYDNDNAYVKCLQYKSDSVGESKFNINCGFSVRYIWKGSTDRVTTRDSAAGYVASGRAHGENGELDKAIADFTEAIRLDPNYEDAYCNRGIAYEQQGLIDMAIADYNKAIQLEPNYKGAYSCRGGAYEEMGNHDMAIADFSKAILFDPQDPQIAYAYWNRGNVYRDMGDRDKAIADYTKAIQISPDDLEMATIARNALKELMSGKFNP